MSPIAGYEKYHVFLGTNEYDVLLFLYINSENGFAGDIIFGNSDFPTLPPNAGGESVVSFGMLPRIAQARFNAIPSTLMGKVSPAVAAKLAEHCPTVKTLPRSEKQFAIGAIAQM